MSTSTLTSQTVAEFARAVRAELSDLGPDEVDDLTDGLEADLGDRLSESDAQDLGDPAAYAEELRAAAGLPHRATSGGGFAAELAGLRQAPAVIATAFREFSQEHPTMRRLSTFIVTLRPLWWLFRAAVVTALIVNVTSPGWWTPINGLNILIGLAVLIVSVQFGRGKWLPFAWMRGLLLAVNVILVLCAPFLVLAAVNTVNNTWYQSTYSESSPDLSSTGLLENGNQVFNVFAYDAQGHPLKNVQLYDQDGKPLNLAGDPSAAFSDAETNGYLTVPNAEVPGRLGWNVFPLDQVKDTAVSNDGTSIKPSAHRIPAEPPFAAAKPLAGAEAQGSSTATSTPTPAPTSTPVPTPDPTTGPTP
jgi:hypothetical protein